MLNMFVNFSCNFLYLYMKTYNYIYLITNNINGKIYVGKHSTDNLNDGYMGSGVALHRAYNKYGIENFTKKILAFADTEEKLNWFERFYIKKYHARTKGYNLTDGGEGTLGYEPWWKGKARSEETKRKISEANKGKKRAQFSEETRKKMSEAHKGKTMSDEQKQKLSDLKKGCKYPNRKPMSEEARKRLSEYRKGRPSHNKGKPMSKETKRKMSEIHKGRKLSEEHKRKISEAFKRKKEAI